MANVTLIHPKLADQEITVDAGGVHHYERSGWKRKDGEQSDAGAAASKKGSSNKGSSSPDSPAE
ncbi:MAG: hypothetical protein ACRDYU_07445 [Actinomycetes bacterium]